MARWRGGNGSTQRYMPYRAAMATAATESTAPQAFHDLRHISLEPMQLPVSAGFLSRRLGRQRPWANISAPAPHRNVQLLNNTSLHRQHRFGAEFLDDGRH